MRSEKRVVERREGRSILELPVWAEVEVLPWPRERLRPVEAGWVVVGGWVVPKRLVPVVVAGLVPKSEVPPVAVLVAALPPNKEVVGCCCCCCAGWPNRLVPVVPVVC